MEIPQANITFRQESNGRAAQEGFEIHLENRLNKLKADIAKRPFLYSGIAFIAGFVSNTFPARILFVILTRLLSLLSVPVLLLMGIMKLSDSVSGSRRNEPNLLQRP